MAGGIAPSSNNNSTSFDPNKNYSIPLAIITTLFFMWGFITCMNDILIPFLKSEFTLNNFQANLVQSAFFGAFFIVSLIYFLVSKFAFDPIARYGYKNAIIIGLFVGAIGCFLFYPAAVNTSFPLFLTALFVLAIGVTILQMGANPYVTLLGTPESSESRLNLTQAFNSLGTTVAPVIGGILIFDALIENPAIGAKIVEKPYIGLGILLIILAGVIFVSPLPKVTSDEDDAENSNKKSKGALAYPHLVLGVICIFAYVGGEVAIGSNLIQYLKDVVKIEENGADALLAIYWGGAMIGRFYGAMFLSGAKINNTSNIVKVLLLLVLSLILGIFLLNKPFLIDCINKEDVLFSIDKLNINEAFIFSGMTVLNVIAFLVGKNKAGITLGVFALTVIFLLLSTVMGSGHFGMWALLSIGLFNSIMFPTIFSLAIKGLGIDTSQGSSLLVMAIVGGGVIPPLQGKLADMTSIQMSFVLPLICYAYIAFYGFIGSKPKVTS